MIQEWLYRVFYIGIFIWFLFMQYISPATAQAFIADYQATVSDVSGAGNVHVLNAYTDIYDPDSLFNGQTFTVPTTGLYQCYYTVRVTNLTSAMTMIRTRILKTNSPSASLSNNTNSNPNTITENFQTSALTYRTAGDTITTELLINNGAGNTADIFGGVGNGSTRFSCHKVNVTTDIQTIIDNHIGDDVDAITTAVETQTTTQADLTTDMGQILFACGLVVCLALGWISSRG